MKDDTTTVAVIPARLASTRLPRKVLADIHGQPLLWYVWRQVKKARSLSAVYVATDSEEVCTTVESWGGSAFMTSEDCPSGTDRIASILNRIEGDRILNIQGDEPLIDPQLIDGMVEAWGKNGGDLITPVYRIRDLETLQNPNVVKVVRGRDGQAYYFSRHPIPFVRDLPIERWLEKHTFWGHVGVYGYRREVLAAFPSIPESSLESAERLEQLRFLEAGFEIRTVTTDYHPVAVDTPVDLERVRMILNNPKLIV
jgi:3-deoxy-manno-octulosonate cytidylyltransferase (CMP-KDO synthetase)